MIAGFAIQNAIYSKNGIVLSNPYKRIRVTF